MIIRTADLDREGLHVESPLNLGPLTSEAAEPIRLTGVVVKGHIFPTNRGLVFRGFIAGVAELACSRCLESFPVEIARQFDLEYAASPPAGHEFKIPDDEMDLGFLEPDGGLDLNQVAEEQIYLELPMKPLCDPDCRGLCPSCGSNLNTEECGCATLAS